MADEAVLIEHIEVLTRTNGSDGRRQVMRDRVALALNIIAFLVRIGR